MSLFERRHRLTRHRLGSTRVRDRHERLQERGKLIVVPLAHDDRELLVIFVSVCFVLWVEDKRSSESVCVASIGVRVHPVGAELSRFVDRNDIGKFVPGRDAAKA